MSLTVDIDGSSITNLCQSIRWRPKLSAPATGIVRVPAHLLSVVPGVSEMHIYMSGGLVFSGPVWYTQADGDPDSAYAEITAYDHLIYLKNRLCKTETGNLITPISVLLDNVTAPAIMAAFIENANTYDSTRPNGNAMPISVGSVAGGGVDCSGAPMAFPMNLDDMRSLLLSTGQLDVMLVPGVGSSVVNLTNGDGGTDLSGSVAYEYGTGAFNCQIATRTIDMDDVVNALWYLLGPRVSEERWAGSITPTARNGGIDGDGPLPGDPWPPALVAKFMGSRTTYGYSQEIRIYDTPDAQDIRFLYELLWAKEAGLRAGPKQLASIRPERGIEPNFSVGDLITVAAGSQLMGGFSGAQRVYEMEVECDADGVVSVTEIIASADQE